MFKFSIDQYDYEITEHGAIKQLRPNIISYDPVYLTKYKRAKTKVNEIANIRMDLVDRYCNGMNLLEVGYGTGDVLKEAHNRAYSTTGFDIIDGNLPDTAINDPFWETGEWDVACFFDVIEHMEDLDWLYNFNSRYVMISLPWCPHQSGGDFKSWSHRHPNEHLWHFDDQSLVRMMADFGFKCIYRGNPEDQIRENIYSPNILTCIFEKLDEFEFKCKSLNETNKMAIMSHGGVGTNYMLDAFNLERLPGNCHFSYLVSNHPTIYLYGDFDNAHASMVRRILPKENLLKKRHITFQDCNARFTRKCIKPCNNDPYIFKSQILAMCDYSNVALLNYPNFTQEHLDIVVDTFNLPSRPDINIKERKEQNSPVIPEYEHMKNFPFGNTKESGMIKNIIGDSLY